MLYMLPEPRYQRINLRRICKKDAPIRIPDDGVEGSTEGYINVMESRASSFSIFSDDDVARLLSWANELEVVSGEGMNEALEAESGEGDSI